MAPHAIEQVRDTFVHALLAPQEAAGHFYGYLFELAPDTRALFSADPATQAQRLIDAMAKIVAGLTRPDAMRPMIEGLALRHLAYGAQQNHYAIVGDAMIHMIRQMSGPGFDSTAEESWREAYAIVADIMVRAAYPATTPDTTPAS